MTFTLPPTDNSGNPSPEEIRAMIASEGGQGVFTASPLPSDGPRSLMREDEGNVTFLRERSMTRRRDLRVLTRARKRCKYCGRMEECCC